VRPLKDNDAVTAAIELAELISGARLRLQKNASPAIPRNVFIKWVCGDSVERANLNKGKLVTGL
jgi:hypothetical protein